MVKSADCCMRRATGTAQAGQRQWSLWVVSSAGTSRDVWKCILKGRMWTPKAKYDRTPIEDKYREGRHEILFQNGHMCRPS